MKVNHKLFAFLLLFCIPLFTSCEISEIQRINMPVSEAESATDAETTASPPAERFTVMFEENEAEAQIRLFIPLSQKDNIEIVGDYIVAQE